MFARPLRFLAPTLAALGLVTLRPACPSSAPAATTHSALPAEGRVVFRHYL